MYNKSQLIIQISINEYIISKLDELVNENKQ